MEASDINEVFISLESYQPWQESILEVSKKHASASTINSGSSIAELERRIDYLKSKSEVRLALSALKAELATKEMDLPLPYLLGSLASLDAISQPYFEENIDASNGWEDTAIFGGLQYGYGSIEKQNMHPDPNQVIRAVQIGDELLRLDTIFKTEKHIPVAIVRGMNVTHDAAFSEVFIGTAVKESFSLLRPTVQKSFVEYTFPKRLTPINNFGVIFARNKDSDLQRYTNIPLTSIERLLHKNDRSGTITDPRVVYVGKSDVNERVEQAKKEKELFLSRITSARDVRRRNNARRTIRRSS